MKRRKDTLPCPDVPFDEEIAAPAELAAPGYPINLDLSNRRILIVGAGEVAARKARGLLDAGAVDITVVAPTFSREFPSGNGKIVAPFATKHLDGIDLVFAATDSPSVNEEIVRECRRRKIWVNRADADDDMPGDFSNPAVLRRGPITVTVSAGNPALSAALRDMLAEGIDDTWAQLAEALLYWRPIVKSSGLPIARRREILRLLASQDAMTIMAGEGPSYFRKWIRRCFPDLPTR